VLEKQKNMKKKYIMKDNEMKDEYDFSKGIKGKFYREDANFNLPIYLDNELQSFISEIAKEQKTTITKIVNNLLFKDKELIELARTKV
jgi:hypothetical protein